MIASLTGLVAAREEDRCVVDVGGVGYLVQASTRTLGVLPAPPEVARLLVETQLREDAITLFGFAEAAERDWFRLLTTVQGVGGRVALNLLSALSPQQLITAIAGGDRASLTQAVGVGARLAARLLTELRDKAGGMPSGALSPGDYATIAAPAGAEAEALSALVNLGYRRAEVSNALARVSERLGNAPLDELIRAALKELAR